MEHLGSSAAIRLAVRFLRTARRHSRPEAMGGRMPASLLCGRFLVAIIERGHRLGATSKA